ncbi:hypothetical protein RO3G_16357 [Rhizopus delemar RA 99-880]|uniref:Uncharacterized protein n=1 Tax=Rhizopus delemar (strain RA 99-880 / ATCC MYA-4621 / FGSC 9543 / NRRL 43880) TaxID=246409 RepID=I1CT66_RHIO9|nr:hypothetical protein RO3G_16357 [Rhizopus delemar RA 99-880]|eukprot:EIE91646.1 hypothetical protein RO3G_16357 [Rhizopus delemar RA 99-880]
MDWEKEVDPYHLQTLTCLKLYHRKQGSEQKSTDKGLDDEMEETVLKTKQQFDTNNCRSSSM